ncbi:hypothetical protein [uncultured Gammaproteobacteria bacterium]|nr:hypothetical protein [uncultured Gammaproteobacteria bacterium]
MGCKIPLGMVSVAGCLGYDVLGFNKLLWQSLQCVSVAGCLGYDVLVSELLGLRLCRSFSCWLFRL